LNREADQQFFLSGRMIGETSPYRMCGGSRSRSSQLALTAGAVDFQISQNTLIIEVYEGGRWREANKGRILALWPVSAKDDAV
jgi:hypothetical protein